jgi:hypothetical protein
MFAWLDRIPLHMIALPAMLLALAPFVPEPHLWQKLKMLAAGELHRPLDIFDLIMHGSGLILLGIKLVRGEKEEG